MSQRITVLTGGSTPEREVALAGAAQVVRAFRDRGCVVTVVDTTRGALTEADEAECLVATVAREPPDLTALAALQDRELGPALVEIPAIRAAEVVFVVLHGRQGEGGELQALLELARVPYTGSGPLGSALAMDKDVTKRLLRMAGIATADWAMWPATKGEIDAVGYPLVVKPSKVGSTVGLTVVESAEHLEAAVEDAQAFDDEVLLERFIEGRELTVGILGDRALAVGEIRPQHGIFDYECKYTPGMSEEIFPAELPGRVENAVRTLALGTHRALKLRDFSRVDFKLRPDGTPLCLEANTLPGLTRTSLLPQSAAAADIGFGELCETIVQLALERSAGRNKVRA